MSLDPKTLEKPLLKLRKLVRKISRVPTQDEVHNVRTNTRRVEATLEALQLDRRGKGRRVLRAVTAMRKQAGEVRDMDVLTGYAATLSNDEDTTCLVKLLEHLGQTRAREASGLRRTVAKHKKAASKRLKACSSFIEKNFNQRRTRKQTEWPVDAAASALRISGELSKWPKLSAQNLHPFRLKVKELRYVLQLSGEDNDFMDKLGEVKDVIGEWHDWTELNLIAKEVLADCTDCGVIKQIQRAAQEKLAAALQRTQQLRNRYFEPEGTNRSRSRGKRMKEPVMEAAARLAS